MAKHTDADLFPWILGGVLITTATLATIIVATHTPASSTPKAPTPSAKSVATPATSAPAAPVQAPPTAQPAAQDGLPPGTVWECIVNGERTFSDAPCGARSSIRQLS